MARALELRPKIRDEVSASTLAIGLSNFAVSLRPWRPTFLPRLCWPLTPVAGCAAIANRRDCCNWPILFPEGLPKSRFSEEGRWRYWAPRASPAYLPWDSRKSAAWWEEFSFRLFALLA